MIEVGWNSEAVALAAEGVVTLTACWRGLRFCRILFVAQVARLAPDVQLIENACEIGI